MSGRLKNTLLISSALLIVLSPNVYYIFAGREIQSPLRQLGFLAFSTGLLLIPLFFFARRLRLFFIILMPFVMLAPLNIFFLYLYKYPITVGMLGSILGTNFDESMEFISGVRTAGAISLFLIVPLTILYIYLIARINRSLNIRIALILSVLFSIYTGIVYFAPPKNQTDAKRMTSSSRLEKFETRLLKTYPAGLVLTFVKYFKESEFIKNRQELFKNKPIHAAKKEALEEREIYVLIIGETARYNNFSINNYYPRETNPKLRATGNLISYTDVCSSSTETRTSVPLLMTEADVSNFPTAFTLPSIITFFKSAGFETYWISNQNSADVNNKSIKVFVNESDNVIYINETVAKFNEEKFKYDEELIPVLNNMLTKSRANKIFVILHTIGNHYRYDFRYPPEFDVFKPSMKGMANVRVDDPATREVKMNSYDNAILYTDYFISSVIKAVSSYKAVSTVIYLSDHGEDIFDDDRNLFLHANKSVTKYVVRVPLFIWFSDSYRTRYPQKIEALLKNKDIKISARNLLDSMLNMADIQYEGRDFDLPESIFSNKLEFMKREILTPDYKTADCDKLL